MFNITPELSEIATIFSQLLFQSHQQDYEELSSPFHIGKLFFFFHVAGLQVEQMTSWIDIESLDLFQFSWPKAQWKLKQ